MVHRFVISWAATPNSEQPGSVLMDERRRRGKYSFSRGRSYSKTLLVQNTRKLRRSEPWLLEFNLKLQTTLPIVYQAVANYSHLTWETGGSEAMRSLPLQAFHVISNAGE